jgi:outer membrane lipoprotein-sorting protein
MNKLVSSILRVAPAFLVLGLVSTAMAETPEELIGRLEQKEAELKTWEFKATMSMTSPYVSMEQTMTQIGERVDATHAKTRMESSGTMTMTGAPEPMKSSSTLVSDGEFVWAEMNGMGQLQVTKQKADNSESPVAALKAQLATNAAVVKDAEEVNGEMCAVLQMTQGEGEQATVTTQWFSEKTGMLLKLESTGGAMSQKMTMIVTEYKVNEGVDSSKFSYTPPAGVEVMDMTAAEKPAAAVAE